MAKAASWIVEQHMFAEHKPAEESLGEHLMGRKTIILEEVGEKGSLHINNNGCELGRHGSP